MSDWRATGGKGLGRGGKGAWKGQRAYPGRPYPAQGQYQQGQYQHYHGQYQQQQGYPAQHHHQHHHQQHHHQHHQHHQHHHQHPGSQPAPDPITPQMLISTTGPQSIQPVNFDYTKEERILIDIVQRHRHRRNIPLDLLTIKAPWAPSSDPILPVPVPKKIEISEEGKEVPADFIKERSNNRVGVLLVTAMPNSEGQTVIRRLGIATAHTPQGEDLLVGGNIQPEDGSGEDAAQKAAVRIAKDYGVDLSGVTKWTPLAVYEYRLENKETATTTVLLPHIWDVEADISLLKELTTPKEEEYEEEVEDTDAMDTDEKEEQKEEEKKEDEEGEKMKEDEEGEKKEGEEGEKKEEVPKKMKKVTKTRTVPTKVLDFRIVALGDAISGPGGITDAGFEAAASADILREMLEKQCGTEVVGLLKEAKEVRDKENTLKRDRDEELGSIKKARMEMTAEKKEAIDTEEGVDEEEKKRKHQEVLSEIQSEFEKKEREVIESFKVKLQSLIPPGKRVVDAQKQLLFSILDRNDNNGPISNTFYKSRAEALLGALNLSLSGKDIDDLLLVLPSKRIASNVELRYTEIIMKHEPLEVEAEIKEDPKPAEETEA